MKLINNIKNVYNDTTNDNGTLAENVILIAVFAVAAILIGGWITTSLINKGADVSQCIEGSGDYTADKSAQNCKDANHAGNGNSYKDQGSFKDRYKS